MSETARAPQEPLMVWTADEVMSATQARPAAGAAAASPSFAAVCTDSRAVVEGCLFVALRGANHDAHRFVAEALRKGATAALVERVPADVSPDRLFVVADTTRALGDLAAWTRNREDWRVVAITGSNGKTTTKEMLASICEQADFPGWRRGVLKTHGNENNTIGLPLTVLRARGDEAVAVLEMGMNHRGEIARLTEIARPDVGVITNVGAAHLEGLGDLDGVAAAKGELYAGMAATATIVVNAEDERVVHVARGFAGRRIEFGPGREVEAQLLGSPRLEELRFSLSVAGARAPVRLAFAGAHNVSNALAAAACAHALGVSVDEIAAGLEAARPPTMRMQVERLVNGVTVINDSYNANPSSMEAGLRSLAAEKGRRWAVLGEMRELGSSSGDLHRDLGRTVAQLGIDFLVAVGDASEDVAIGALRADGRGAVQVAGDAGAAADLITSQWRAGDVVFVKGSRGPDDDPAVRRFGSRMAEVVARLQEAGARG
jgi:UDP-N-acetylmuramoyl-tripeptide--D-alanyl-D-alanine ligase